MWYRSFLKIHKQVTDNFHPNERNHQFFIKISLKNSHCESDVTEIFSLIMFFVIEAFPPFVKQATITCINSKLLNEALFVRLNFCFQS